MNGLPTKYALPALGLLAAYMAADITRVRRHTARAALERFPIGQNFTLENPAAPRSRPLRYLAVGDSTVQGDGASSATATMPYRIAEALGHLFQWVEMRNIGVSGATTGDVLREQLPQFAGFRPDLVLISIGANDVTHLKTRAEYLANVDRILEAIDALPGARTVILTAPALDTAPVLSPLFRLLVGVQTRHYNRALLGVVAGHRAIMADTYHATRPHFARNPALYARDGYHPSDAGYALWARTAESALATAVADL